jgi:hypothetical protein
MRSRLFPARNFLSISSPQRPMSKYLNISKACSREASPETLSIGRNQQERNEPPFFDLQVLAVRKKSREVRYRIAQLVIHSAGQTERSSGNLELADANSDLSTERGPCKIALNSRDSGHCIRYLALRDAIIITQIRAHQDCILLDVCQFNVLLTLLR